MVNFKLVISEPKGKTVQKEVKDNDGNYFLNKKVGDKVDGSSFGFSGFEFAITGGSDNCGFPMRKGVPGTKRRKILTLKSVGFSGIAKGRTKRKKKNRPTRSGLRRKKSVCGEIIHEKISQINLKVLKAGKENIFPEKAEAKEGKEENKEPAEKPKKEKAEAKEESKEATEKTEAKKAKEETKEAAEKPKKEKAAEKKE